MKKINFSKKGFKKKIKKAWNFLRNRYVTFFKNYPIFIFFVVSNLLNTLLLRIITVNNGGYLKPLFMDLAMILIVASIACFFKSKKVKNRFLVGFSIFVAILCIIHSIYYTYYDSFASISLLATSTFVVDVGDAVVKRVMRIQDFVYLWQPFFMFYVVYQINKKSKRDNKKVNGDSKKDRRMNFATLFVTGVVIFGITCATMTPVEWSRFGKMWNRESVASSFGIFTYQVNDIVQSLEPKINNLFGHDKALKTVTDYYDENEVEVEENAYTDIFKGKNVIVIHAESLQSVAIGRKFEGNEVTPTLNKLVDEGIYFSNFYSQVGVGTSSDAEFTFSTSLMPSNNGTVFVNYFDREYNTIQKLFKNSGYYTFSMHANTGDFWNRATMHENMGYDKFYSKSSFDIDETIGLGLSDKSFFKQVVPKIQDIVEKKNKPFYGTLITLTNHTPWSDLKLMDDFPTTWTVDIDGEKVTRDYINGTTLGDYFRSVHYADQALGQLIEDMDSSGLLDNTVLVIYGDHDARVSKKYYNMMYNYDPYTDTIKKEGDEGYVDYNEYEYQLDKKVPFIIWTKDSSKGGKYQKTIDEPAGMIDVLPTLSNMFGVGNNKYQLGHDLFSVKDNTVVFTNGSYLTNKIYYDGQSGEVYTLKDDTVSSSYINEHSDYADDLIDVSNDIITYDLIKEMNSKED